jgi:ubiquinone/menaquinone biosynthesis C-methylase UbiE
MNLRWLLIACAAGAPFGQSLPGQTGSVKPGINSNYMDPNLNVDEWVERFEREGREVFDRRQELVDAIGLEPGMAVADIGTGTGLFLPLLAGKVGPGGRVYAVDIVPRFLERIETVAAENNWNTVKTVLCTARSVELPEESIDVAYICDVYHHFEYPNDSLASIHKALKPGGLLFLVEFKRTPGESSEWTLNHVRAGRDTFEKEIVGAGFTLVEEVDGILENNYVLRFRKQ